MSLSVADQDREVYRVALGLTDIQAAKLSQTDLELMYLEAGGGGADINEGRTWFPPDDPELRPIHENGDDFASSTLDAAWTPRNLAVGHLVIPPADPGVSLYFDAAGDGLWRPAPAGDFEIVATFHGLNGTDSGAMVGIGIVNASGNGVGASAYSGGFGFYTWTLLNYIHSASGPMVAFPLEDRSKSADLMYMALRKTGTNYTARYSLDGTTWSAYTVALANANTMTQMGVGRFIVNGGSLKCTLHRFNVYPGPGFYS